jgi:hypothetical protein
MEVKIGILTLQDIFGNSINMLKEMFILLFPLIYIYIYIYIYIERERERERERDRQKVKCTINNDLLP